MWWRKDAVRPSRMLTVNDRLAGVRPIRRFPRYGLRLRTVARCWVLAANRRECEGRGDSYAPGSSERESRDGSRLLSSRVSPDGRLCYRAAISWPEVHPCPGPRLPYFLPYDFAKTRNSTIRQLIYMASPTGFEPVLPP